VPADRTAQVGPYPPAPSHDDIGSCGPRGFRASGYTVATVFCTRGVEIANGIGDPEVVREEPGLPIIGKTCRCLPTLCPQIIALSRIIRRESNPFAYLESWRAGQSPCTAASITTNTTSMTTKSSLFAADDPHILPSSCPVVVKERMSTGFCMLRPSQM
jgi:hypothetical protein